ncbi:MAG: Decarbamoylnovobiocin carbamoyltransferase [Syntrophorhabdaceae bacterium PtaU1.Bin034]|nr:MAG: Decarbamoylnovobiocin carbamoyltransferase [Syntrophorhabdaceae bacterium PtaU1.Bin034]
MNILGINAYHGDSSAALLQDGRLVAAVEEERFNRIKHWAGFPAQSIKYCLQEGGVAVRDLDHIAVSFNPKANISNKLLFTIRNRPDLRTILHRLRRQSKSFGIMGEIAHTFGCDRKSIRAEFHAVEHHSAHVASTFFTSPFEKAAILSIDGMGDFVSTLTAWGEGNGVRTLNKVYYPHSLGFLYCAVTMLLGFPRYGDEYKVMGLAPYGAPAFADEFRKIVYPKDSVFELNPDYFHHQMDGASMLWKNGEPSLAPFHSPLLEKALGIDLAHLSPSSSSRQEDIAASLQCVTEEIVIHLLNKLHDACPCDNLCLAGGVAMNSVVNGKISRHTGFKNIHVPPGAADNGGSFGAAFYVWNSLLKKPRQFVMQHAFWGPEFNAPEIRKTIERNKDKIAVREYGVEGLVEKVADALCEGKIVGWYQGRMEFGARALGHRSLLADPRREDARDIINLKIKFREKFRPFAPSVLKGKTSEYFEDDIDSPFMEKVVPVRQNKRPLIPAVTHVDGSGRLQTVDSASNPLYYRLIQAFEKRTRIPLILNTSLNENEPIVCSPEEALQCFLRTKMDAMVLGNHYITRP